MGLPTAALDLRVGHARRGAARPRRGGAGGLRRRGLAVRAQRGAPRRGAVHHGAAHRFVCLCVRGAGVGDYWLITPQPAEGGTSVGAAVRFGAGGGSLGLKSGPQPLRRGASPARLGFGLLCGGPPRRAPLVCRGTSRAAHPLRPAARRRCQAWQCYQKPPAARRRLGPPGLRRAGERGAVLGREVAWVQVGPLPGGVDLGVRGKPRDARRGAAAELLNTAAWVHAAALNQGNGRAAASPAGPRFERQNATTSNMRVAAGRCWLLTEEDVAHAH
jgi:hypothetical protein